MTTTSPSCQRPVGLGLLSAVLGSVGLVLFFLPVLSIPLGAAGLACGIVGFLVAVFSCWSSPRWSVAGIVVSATAFGIGIMIWLAPIHYSQEPPPANVRPMVPDYRPYVPPPARPGT